MPLSTPPLPPERIAELIPALPAAHSEYVALLQPLIDEAQQVDGVPATHQHEASHQQQLQHVLQLPSNRLPSPPKPTPFNPPKSLSSAEYVAQLQDYLRQYTYNHTGSEFTVIDKAKPMSHIHAQVQQMINQALPIKCLEAVCMAMVLSKDRKLLLRMPLRFRSYVRQVSEVNVAVKPRDYWHIVLLLYDTTTQLYGTISLSRRTTLDYRPLKFDKPSDIIQSFLCSYAEIGHIVDSVTIGLPFDRDVQNMMDAVYWKLLIATQLQPMHQQMLDSDTCDKWQQLARCVDLYCKDVTSIGNSIRRENRCRVSNKLTTLVAIQRKPQSKLFELLYKHLSGLGPTVHLPK